MTSCGLYALIEFNCTGLCKLGLTKEQLFSPILLTHLYCVPTAAPSSTVSVTSNAGQTPLLGSFVVLDCIISLPATLNGVVGSIQWMFEDVPITISGIYPNLTSSSSSLVIDSITTANGGKYMCIAEIASPFLSTFFHNDSLTIEIQCELLYN